MSFLLCGMLSRVTMHGVLILPSRHVSFFPLMMHLAAINTMASHLQYSSHSHFPLEMLPSLASLPVPLCPSVISLAAILVADNLFLGSGSAHASFSNCLPLLHLS